MEYLKPEILDVGKAEEVILGAMGGCCDCGGRKVCPQPPVALEIDDLE